MALAVPLETVVKKASWRRLHARCNEGISHRVSCGQREGYAAHPWSWTLPLHWPRRNGGQYACSGAGIGGARTFPYPFCRDAVRSNRSAGQGTQWGRACNCGAHLNEGGECRRERHGEEGLQERLEAQLAAAAQSQYQRAPELEQHLEMAGGRLETAHPHPHSTQPSLLPHLGEEARAASRRWQGGGSSCGGAALPRQRLPPRGELREARRGSGALPPQHSPLCCHRRAPRPGCHVKDPVAWVHARTGLQRPASAVVVRRLAAALLPCAPERSSSRRPGPRCKARQRRAARRRLRGRPSRAP